MYLSPLILVGVKRFRAMPNVDLLALRWQERRSAASGSAIATWRWATMCRRKIGIR